MCRQLIDSENKHIGCCFHQDFCCTILYPFPQIEIRQGESIPISFSTFSGGTTGRLSTTITFSKLVSSSCNTVGGIGQSKTVGRCCMDCTQHSMPSHGLFSEPGAGKRTKAVDTWGKWRMNTRNAMVCHGTVARTFVKCSTSSPSNCTVILLRSWQERQKPLTLFFLFLFWKALVIE